MVIANNEQSRMWKCQGCHIDNGMKKTILSRIGEYKHIDLAFQHSRTRTQSRKRFALF